MKKGTEVFLSLRRSGGRGQRNTVPSASDAERPPESGILTAQATDNHDGTRRRRRRRKRNVSGL